MLYLEYSRIPDKKELDILATRALRKYHTYDIGAQQRFRHSFHSAYRHRFAKEMLAKHDATHDL
jgi:hypothetical protein